VDGQELNLEPPYSTDEYFEEILRFMDSTPIAKYVIQDQCCDLNIGGEGNPKDIQFSKHFSRQEKRAW
jgi:hypothetical protein